jgi:uncharacterized protein DUF3302
MTGIDYFAWIVLLIILGSVIVGVVVLGALPGKVAEQRGHPQADAIRVAGWLGLLLTGGLLWVVAMIWAFTRLRQFGLTDQFEARVTALEKHLKNSRGTSP